MRGRTRRGALAWVAVGAVIGTAWAWGPRIAQAVSTSATTIYDSAGTNAASVNKSGQLSAVVSTAAKSALNTVDVNGPALGTIHFNVHALTAPASCAQLVPATQNAVVRSLIFSVNAPAAGSTLGIERGTCGSTLVPLFTYTNDKALVASDSLSYSPGLPVPKTSVGVVGGLVLVDTPGVPVQVQTTYFTSNAVLLQPNA